MKKNLHLILSAAACVLAVVSLTLLIFMRQQMIHQSYQISSIENDISRLNDHVRASMDVVSSQVRDSLEQQASILASYEIVPGKMDPQSLTIPFTYTVTPKEVTPGVTTAELICEDNSYPMTLREDGSFTAQIQVPLFSTLSTQRVVFTENGTSRTETISSPVTSYSQWILVPYANLTGTMPVQKARYQLKGELNVTASIPPEVGIVSLDLIAERNGKEIDRISYLDSVGDSFDGVSADVDLDYDLPPNSILTMYVEIEDTYGLRYQQTVEQISTDQEGCFIDSSYTSGYDDPMFLISIIDRQGNLLWTGHAYDLMD